MGNAYFMFLALLFVNGVFAVELETETHEHTEGETVTLASCVTKIATEDFLEWKFKSQVIATIKANNALLNPTNDELFQDRLQINEQTGDLTIRNTRTKHSGIYEVTVTNNLQKTSKRFAVTILDPMPKKVSVTEGETAELQHDIADIQDYGLIEWKFEKGMTPIAEIDIQKSQDPRYQREGLRLNKNGCLTILKAKTTDSGLYQLQVTRQGTSAKTKLRKFRVEVNEAASSIGIIVGIIVAAVLVVAVAVGICYCKSRSVI